MNTRAAGLTDGIKWRTENDGEGSIIYAEFDGRTIRTRINNFPLLNGVGDLARFAIEQMKNHICIVRARERFAAMH